MPTVMRQMHGLTSSVSVTFGDFQQDFLSTKRINGDFTNQIFSCTNKERLFLLFNICIIFQAVSNPDIAARRKIKKNLAKQEAKKRKLETFRTSKKIKKQRLQSMAVIDG